MAERTRHIHMQRSFRFLIETTKFVDERDVSETTGFSKVDLSSECIGNTVTGACYITGCPRFFRTDTRSQVYFTQGIRIRRRLHSLVKMIKFIRCSVIPITFRIQNLQTPGLFISFSLICLKTARTLWQSVPDLSRIPPLPTPPQEKKSCRFNVA